MSDVTLKRSGILVAAYGLSPEIRDRLTAAMEYDHRAMGPDGRGGLQMVVTRRRLWSMQDDGSLLFQCGFVPTAYRIVEAAGGRVVEYLRLDRRPEIEYDLSRLDVDNLREGQTQMISAFVAHEGGLIVSPTGSGKSYGMREICAMYPGLNIIIAAPGIEAVATLNRYLSEKFPGEVGQMGGGKKHTRRITISTFDSLMKVETLDKTDILIVDEVHRAPAAKYATSIAACTYAVKRFGFTATAEGRGDGAELMNTGMFGDVVLDIGFYEAESRGEVAPVHVIVHEHKRGPSGEVLKSMQQANKDRKAIWRNDGRNRLIRDDVLSLLEGPDDLQVLVIVSKAEHAYALGALLPDFQIVTGNLDKKARGRLQRRGINLEEQGVCSKKDRDELRTQFERGELRRVIATEIWSASVSSDDCDIVVFASGSGSTITFLQSVGRGTRVKAGKLLTTCLVYRDMFAPAYKARSDKLISAAKKQGHKITVVRS